MVHPEKKVPSWLPPRPPRSEGHHLRQYLNHVGAASREEVNPVDEVPLKEATNSSVVEHEQPIQKIDKQESQEGEGKQIVVGREESDDDDDTRSDLRQRQSILPTNLQVSPPGKKPGLFRKWRSSAEDRSVTSDLPTPEFGASESGSVASYMKGFSGATVGSAATNSSLRSKFMRMLTNSGSSVASSSRPPKPPARLSIPRPTKGKDVRLPPRPPKPSGEPKKLDNVPSVAHSEMDPTPTHRSISTLDTEEGTLESGVPSVIYCFIKVNPFEDDDDGDLNASHSSVGRLFHLPKAISKRLVKKKNAEKTHFDEMDEESYVQTLVVL